MPELLHLEVAEITRSPEIFLSPGFRLYIEEAVRFCLDYNNHLAGKVLEVDGHYQGRFELRWIALARNYWNAFADCQAAVEHAAYGIAFLLMLTLTEHRVIQRSAKGTGFDFWLGNRGVPGFQNHARLEISGILLGPSRVRSRGLEKQVQSRRSDSTGLPVYVVIVEFSHPKSRIALR
jgi:hypothetical protein